MATDLDTLIKDLESTAVNLAVKEVLQYLTANVWAGFGLSFISPIAGWFIAIVVDVLMQKLDWLSYMLVTDWENSKEGANYESAAKALQNLPPQATPDEIAKAEAAKILAFKALVSLGSPTP